LILKGRERALLSAFAEALLPASARLPGVEGKSGVPVCDPVAQLLAGAPPRMRLAARLALWAFELTTFPRRFSKLPLGRRAAHLERLAASARGVRRELFGLLKTLSTLAYARDPRVQQIVGVSARCELDEGRRPAAVGRLDPAVLRGGESGSCDVVIVGSGAGGAAAARVLAEAGLSTTVVEEGDYHDASSYATDPLAALPMLYRDGGLTFCEGRPAIPMPLGRCVGGTTVINSGTCLRPPGEVLAGWRDRHGIDWAPSLEQEMDSLERDLAVAPVDGARAGRNAELCRLGADAIGASNGPLSRNADGVTCCGTCPTGCALDAKLAMHVSELPRAAVAGARIDAGARVERVLIEHGRAVGVECRTTDGRRYQLRARAVVLAAGAIGTPELLLSQGVGNGSGSLGRGLHIHPACWVGARFDEDVRGWDGVMQSWHVDQWKQRGLFLEATFTPFAFGAHWLPGAGEPLMRRIADYGKLAVLGVHLSERTSAGRVRVRGGRARIGYRLSGDDAATMRYGIARAAEILFAAGAVEVYPQLAGLPLVSRADGTAPIERARLRPSDLRLEAFHPMGTAVMGADPAASVVSPAGELHDLPGLLACDASILPTSLGVNPMLTIMACARRIARELAERLS
jgi:choline dehydrogenase-like flavoprotein